MTEKHDYTATIRGKGLDGTGVTEDIAKSMYHTKGKRTLAIVELVHKRQVDDEDTGRKVELAISLLEPSTSPELDDHLRELTKTMHQNRVLKSTDDQLQIDTLDAVEPTVEQVIEAGKQHIAETDDELPEKGEKGDWVVRDDTWTDEDLNRADHVHTADGDCIKNRHGELCDPEADLAPDDEPWEYDQPEPHDASTIPSPFATSTTPGGDAA